MALPRVCQHAIADNLAQLPPSMRRSLTWDRGREMAEHQQLAAQLGLDVYFCDPRSPLLGNRELGEAKRDCSRFSSTI